MSVTQNAPASMYRTKEDLGVWEHRGKVAVVGIGHSPTFRRWDERLETSVGYLTIQAIQKALEGLQDQYQKILLIHTNRQTVTLMMD